MAVEQRLLAMDNRAKLLTKVFDQGFRTPDSNHSQPPPLVTLEDFFEGNHCKRSIAPNLANEHPGLEFFYEYLKNIRACDDVQDVSVNIFDLTDIIFSRPDGWPYTENIHILTSASKETVELWAKELFSDGAIEGWPYGKSPIAPEPHKGYRWWSIAWD